MVLTPKLFKGTELYTSLVVCVRLLENQHYFIQYYKEFLLQLSSHTQPTQLKNIGVCVCNSTTKQALQNVICELNYTFNTTSILTSVTMDSHVVSYQAVVTSQKELANKGDFVVTSYSEVNLAIIELVTILCIHVNL